MNAQPSSGITLREGVWLGVRVVLALGAAYAYHEYGPDLKDERMRSVAEALGTIAGTLLGFLLTAVSILTAVLERPLVATMRKTGHFELLMQGTYATCAVLFALTFLSILCLFMDGTTLVYTFDAVVGFAVLGTAYCLETGWRFALTISFL